MVPDGLCRSGGRRDNSEMLLLGRRLQESSPEGSHTLTSLAIRPSIQR